MSDKKTNKQTTDKKTVNDPLGESSSNPSFDREKYILLKISELQTRNLQDTEMVETFLQSVKELNQFGNMVLDELVAQRDEILNLKSILKNPHKTRQKKLAKFKVQFHKGGREDPNDPPTSGAL